MLISMYQCLNLSAYIFLFAKDNCNWIVPQCFSNTQHNQLFVVQQQNAYAFQSVDNSFQHQTKIFISEMIRQSTMTSADFFLSSGLINLFYGHLFRCHYIIEQWLVYYQYIPKWNDSFRSV